MFSASFIPQPAESNTYIVIIKLLLFIDQKICEILHTLDDYM